MKRHRLRQGLPVRTAGRSGLFLALSLLVSLADARTGRAADPPSAPGSPALAAAPASVMTLNLAECLHLALQHQPALAAQRASLAAAEDSYRALEKLHLPTLFARDLPIRRQEAALGVTAAAAGLDQVEREAVYAVTRTYFAVLYARAQRRVAGVAVERLSAIAEATQQRLKAGAREVADTDADRALVYLRLAEARRLQADEGMERALAALKEAVGLAPACCLQVPPGDLPEPAVQLCRQDVIAWALARRGDLVQAGTFADVTGLEVDAQGRRWHLRVETFAAGADIHARAVPPTFHDSEYRPGAVPPEMPTALVGSRSERQHRALSLNARAAAVVDKTRNLIVLEAEDAYLRWDYAVRKIARAREAADAGDRLADSLRTDFISRQKVRVEEVINAQVLASEARVQYHEYLYQQVLALADLERVTAGAFCAGLAGPTPSRPQPAPGSNGSGTDAGRR